MAKIYIKFNECRRRIHTLLAYSLNYIEKWTSTHFTRDGKECLLCTIQKLKKGNKLAV